MRFVGDVHGKYKQYKRLIKDVPASIQVGDLGLGFIRPQTMRPMQNPPHYAMVRGNHRFIRGNHDNPNACRFHSQWIPDGTVEGDMMLVGGAVSIDIPMRVEGLTWWPDEELSSAEMMPIVDRYISEKPKIMVSHECPDQITEIILALSDKTKLELQSCTRHAFQTMFEAHQPDIWIFGHYHQSLDRVIEGTRFICLAELEFIDLDV
jgi:predicted phosphodiesterase